MAAIARYDNREAASGGRVIEVVITVDDGVVGTITLSPSGQYYAKTKGLVPALDDITGTSFNDVWSKIVERVRSGGVYLTKLVTDVRESQRA